MFNDRDIRRLKEQKEYAERQLERIRYEQQQESERSFEERQRQRAEREQQRIRQMRQADNWPDAFRKNRVLLQHERNLSGSDEEELKVFFGRLCDVCDRGAELYAEAMKEVGEEIARLENEAREKVILALYKEFDHDAEDLCDALKKNDPQLYLEW